jgi:hypothetical protein
MIKTQIGHDAINPSIERALEAKVPHALVRFQERFLINVLGFAFRPGKVHGETEHRLVVVVHQFLESGAIATLRFADQ